MSHGWSAPLTISPVATDAREPDIALDSRGSGVAVWSSVGPSGDVVGSAIYDRNGPLLTALSLPKKPVAGVPLRFSVAASDVWSGMLQTLWGFGDGLGKIGTSVGSVWFAYEPRVGVTRIIDTKTGHRFKLADPSGCAGGLATVGAGQLLYRCSDPLCPNEGSSCWFFINWHTGLLFDGEGSQMENDEEVVQDLNRVGLFRSLCAPLIRPIDEVSYAERWFFQSTYAPPFEFTDGRLWRCGRRVPLLVSANSMLAGHTLAWTGSSTIYSTRLRPRGPGWVGAVYSARLPRGWSGVQLTEKALFATVEDRHVKEIYSGRVR